MLKGAMASISSGCIKWRLLSVFILALAVSGCATTQSRIQNDQIESRLTDLEKKSEAKEAEITDLQYQVKDLSSKIDSLTPPESGQASPNFTDQVESVSTPEVPDHAQVIRVRVSPKRIQRALKSAGVYTGPVDGKIGAATKAAIIKFQKKHGLKSDGVLGKKTWEELKAYLK